MKRIYGEPTLSFIRFYPCALFLKKFIMDTYEKKYNEALERARNLMEQVRNNELLGFPDQFTEIFPELRESEDERIRKDIIGGLMWQRDNLKSEGPHDNNLILPGFCLTVGKLLTYLEKQKEQNHDGKKWIFEDEYQKDLDRLYNEGKDEVLNNPAKYGLQKEQKPASTEDMPYITDEHFYEREPADSFKYKLAEYMTKNCKKGEGPYGYSYNISSESILQMAKEELIKRGELKEQKSALTPERIHPKFAVGDTVCRPMWSDHTIREIYVRCNDPVYVCVNDEGTESHISFSEQDEWERKEQTPAEWSEEDEKMIKDIIYCLPKMANGRVEMLPSVALDYANRLKSLRPQWKPSEEQMNALNFAITYFMHETNYKNPTELRDLYDDLLKLKQL